MLITNLGRARLDLLASFKHWPDEQLNLRPDEQSWSAAQVLHRIAAVEQELATTILNALGTRSEAVAERAPEALEPAVEPLQGGVPPVPGFTTREALVQALEEARFRHLQRVFNETHESQLARMSLPHPLLGPLSLKNLVDLVWLNDRRAADRIGVIGAQLNSAGTANAGHGHS